MANYVIENENLRVIICSFGAEIISMKDKDENENININENQPIEKRSIGAMTIYFASVGENIWDIARKYIADV